MSCCQELGVGRNKGEKKFMARKQAYLSSLLLLCLFTLLLFQGGRDRGVAQAQMDPETAAALSTLTTQNSDHPLAPPEPVFPVDSDLSINTAQSTSIINLDDFRADARFSGIDGSGVAVVVLDTGIDLDHSFFGPDQDNNNISDRIVFQYDFANNDGDATDFHGHGSNVTSIVGSNDGQHTGMAPDVDLIHLKVFTDAGAGTFSYTESALQWVVANAVAYNIVSVNLSLGDSGNYNSSLIAYGIGDEIAAIRSLGVAVVSAAGNDFYNFSSAQGVAYPAADPNSMAIGAVYDANIGSISYSSGASATTTGPDRVTPFSQRHQTMSTIFAPGAAIVGAGTAGNTVSMHGTSQAAPHIAGIIALMQELALEKLGRKLTVNEIETILDSTADLVKDGDDENDNVTNTGLNFPRVDVFVVGEAILAMAGVDSVPPIIEHVSTTAVTDDGELSPDEITNANITAIQLTFNELMNDPAGNNGADDVTNPANYLLVSAGQDNDFETAVCPTAQGNDVAIPITNVSYSAGSKVAELTLNNGTPLPTAKYRLLACGSTTLMDEAGNPLDGNGNGSGGDDFWLDFIVDQVGPTVSQMTIGGQTAVDKGTVVANVTAVKIHFDEPMNDPAGHTDAGDVTNPAHYQLIQDGENDGIETPICGTIDGDDTAVQIDSISYNSASQTATVGVNGGLKLPNDGYQFVVCGSGSLQDEAGNYFYDGSNEFSITFMVEEPVEYLLYFPVGLR